MNRARGLVLLLTLLLAAAAVGGYFAWRPRVRAVPAVATEGLDAEVAALINQARDEVVAQPTSAEAWGHLGMVLFAQNMYADCPGILAEAERLAPDDVRWPYYRGLALILHDPPQGIAVLERAARIPPRVFTVRLRLAEEYLKLNRMDDADALFSELLIDHPSNPRVFLGQGLVLSRHGHWQDALAPLTSAAEHPTARRAARVALAEAYKRLGNNAQADLEHKRALEGPGDMLWPDEFLAAAQRLRTGLQPRIDQTLVLSENAQHEEAAALISEVLRDHPNSDEAHLTRAKVLIRIGAIAGAQQELRRAIQLNARLVDGHFLLAGTLMLQQDYAAAERSYLRVIELKPAEGLAHFNIGDCRLKQGQRAKAESAFRDALRYRPDLAVAHLELGALLLEDGAIADATTHLEHAVRLDAQNERGRGLLEKARAKKP